MSAMMLPARSPEGDPGRFAEFAALFPELDPAAGPGGHVTADVLVEDMIWAEGPTYVPHRRAVIVSDVVRNQTWRLSYDGGAQSAEPAEASQTNGGPQRGEVDVRPSHHQNGHTIDAEGLLVACSHGERAVVRQERDGSWTTLADAYQGKRLSSPNDVALHPDGSLWFTDPTYGIDKPEEGYGGTREQPFNGVYRLDPDGTLTAVITDRDMPNGLAFAAPDLLLLADTTDAAPGPATYGYRLTGTGKDTVAQLEREWFRVDPGLTDGLRLDSAGRIWTSAGDGVHVLTPDGSRELGRIVTPETVANLCFAGPQGSDLIIAATSRVYRVRTAVTALSLG